MATAKSAGPIRFNAEELYPIAEVRRQLQLGQWAWKTARQRGLRTIKISNRGYCRGADIIAYIDAQSTPSNGAA